MPQHLFCLSNAADTMRKAESLARDGLDEIARYTHVRRDSETPDQHALRKNQLASKIHDAIGWSLAKQGRLDEAEGELHKALELDPRRWLVSYHLGAVREERGDLDAAESLVSRSLATPMGGTNPSEEALSQLYVQRHGSREGYRDYRKSLARQHSARRRDEIVGDRFDAEVWPRFRLESIGGGHVELADLRGNVVVVNFWGIWCSWCLVELPEFQLLAEQYEHDPEVVILLINNDKEQDKVRDWMIEKGFYFRSFGMTAM